MAAILQFIYHVLHLLIVLSIWVVLIYAAFSWLITFNVINMRNRTVYQIVNALERMAQPLLAPFRRFIPTFGGLDISPVLYVIIVGGIDTYLLPPLFGYLVGLFGGGTYSV